MAKEGIKSLRDVPEIYDEVKRQRCLALTDNGLKLLDELAKSFQLSRSELVERIGRGYISVVQFEKQELEFLLTIANQQNSTIAEVIRLACNQLIQQKTID